MKIIRLIILTFHITLGYSQSYETPKSFEYLKKFTVNEKWKIFAFLPPNTNTNVGEVKYRDRADADSKEIGFIKISENQKSDFLLSFSNGMSDDPTYEFYKKEADEFVYMFDIIAQQIFIPGNGFIYVSGIADNFFNKKSKYHFVNDKISEVKQPLYYVGLQTKTLKEIKIFSDKEQSDLLAILPKNSFIEVVASEYTANSQFYLVKNSFGLLGWWRMDNWMSEEIRGLFFHGD